MDNPEPDLNSELMALTFKIRDFFAPHVSILKEVRIKPGLSVLDYGCRSGSYINAASGLVGESGKIYALDIHPIAIWNLCVTVNPSSIRLTIYSAA